MELGCFPRTGFLGWWNTDVTALRGVQGKPGDQDAVQSRSSAARNKPAYIDSWAGPDFWNLFRAILRSNTNLDGQAIGDHEEKWALLMDLAGCDCQIPSVSSHCVAQTRRMLRDELLRGNGVG